MCIVDETPIYDNYLGKMSSFFIPYVLVRIIDLEEKTGQKQENSVEILSLDSRVSLLLRWSLTRERLLFSETKDRVFLMYVK